MPRPLTARYPTGAPRNSVARFIFLALAATLFAATHLQAQDQPVPDYKPQGFVNDFANVLSQPTRDQLTTLCTEVDQKAVQMFAEWIRGLQSGRR